MWKVLLICLILTNPITLILTSSQTATPSEALSLFRAEKYEEALVMYEQLLARNNRDVNNNYYYGVSLFKLNQRNNEAIQRLKIAVTRPPSPDAHYYLGKLYQGVYETNLAIEQFERFISLNRGNTQLVEDAERSIDDCKSAETLINKYFAIETIRKDTINKSELLQYYNPSKDAGQLLKAGDFFRVGVNPEQLIFRTERGNEVYFPILGNNGTYDLYKIVRLLDSWTEAESLGNTLNSEHNELYPFLLMDGTTLYFSSDRPGGMGGFDIYQSFFDPETGTFSEPSNLGPPFNSPDDDFLLVPDVNTKRAWFATNRGVGKDHVIVSEIVWDNNVVRYFTEDVNQIKTLAQLPISKEAQKNSATTENTGNADKQNIEKGNFKFAINDTLIYTRNEHFLSSEALLSFTQGQNKATKKDSLNNEMNARRRAYARSYDQAELLKLIDEIVALERQTYGIDQEINRSYLNARRKEIEVIRQLQSQGRYQPATSARQPKNNQPKTVNQIALENLNKSEFSFYTNDEFNLNTLRLREMYNHFFNEHQISDLQRSDSLYMWANIMSLESARTLEQTRSVPAQPTTMRQRLSNTEEDEDIENQEIKALIDLSRELKYRSLQLYEQALDQKFVIYYTHAKEFGATSKQTGSEDMLKRAVSSYQEAEQSIATMTVYNPQRLENLLSLKRKGVDMMEESLFIEMAGVPVIQESSNSESTRFFDAPSGSIQPSYPAIHRGEENQIGSQQPISNLQYEKPVKNATPSLLPNSNQTLEYKIQIGVFRNEPNANAVAKIPPVSKEYLPDNGLHKYYSGSWNKHSEAQTMVQAVRDAGFPGAFVVAFLNGESISVEKAKSLEQN